MRYEVFIPAADEDKFDVTLEVEATNWMQALKTGLGRVGESQVVRSVVCDIKDDNTIHVTDAATMRVFKLRERGEDEPSVAAGAPVPAAEPAPAPPDPVVTPTLKVAASEDDFISRRTVQIASTGDPENQATGPIASQNFEVEVSVPASAHDDAEILETQATLNDATDLSAILDDGAEEDLQTLEVEPPSTSEDKTPLAGVAAPADPLPVAQAPPAAALPEAPAAQAPVVEAAEVKIPVVEARAGEPPAADTRADDIERATEQALQNVDLGDFLDSVDMSAPAPGARTTVINQQAVTFGEARVTDDARLKAKPRKRRLTAEIGVGEMSLDEAEKPKNQERATVVGETHTKKRAPAMTVKIGRPEELTAVAENALEEVFIEIQTMHEFAEIDDAADFALDLAVRSVGAESGAVLFATPNGSELYFACARGPKAAQVKAFRVPMGRGIAGFCTRDGVSLLIADAAADARFHKEISESIGYECRSLICAPIQFGGRVYGCIELLNPRQERSFTGKDLNVLNYVGYQLGKFVQNVLFGRD